MPQGWCFSNYQQIKAYIQSFTLEIFIEYLGTEDTVLLARIQQVKHVWSYTHEAT